MSIVQNFVLVAGATGEPVNDTQYIREINYVFGDFYRKSRGLTKIDSDMLRSVTDDRIPEGFYERGKAFEEIVLVGAFNHLDLSKLVPALRRAKELFLWHVASDFMQVFSKSSGESMFGMQTVFSVVSGHDQQLRQADWFRPGEVTEAGPYWYWSGGVNQPPYLVDVLYSNFSDYFFIPAGKMSLTEPMPVKSLEGWFMPVKSLQR